MYVCVCVHRLESVPEMNYDALDPEEPKVSLVYTHTHTHTQDKRAGTAFGGSDEHMMRWLTGLRVCVRVCACLAG